MNRFCSLISMLTCITVVVLVTSCEKSVAPEDIYRHKSEYQGSGGAKDIVVETTQDGSYELTAFTDNSRCPMETGLEEVVSGQIQKVRFFPDALGSENIRVVINEKVGYTDIAGLRFTEGVTLNIWEDGIVEVDREEVEARDKKGNAWISKRVNVEGETAIIMMRKK